MTVSNEPKPAHHQRKPTTKAPKLPIWLLPARRLRGAEDRAGRFLRRHVEFQARLRTSGPPLGGLSGLARRAWQWYLDPRQAHRGG